MVCSVVLPLVCVSVCVCESVRCVFTLCVAFPRRSLDAAHLAGDPADLLRAAPPAAHPGPPQRLQLHPRGRVHGGAAHARPAAHVPDPASLQGAFNLHTNNNNNNKKDDYIHTLPDELRASLLGVCVKQQCHVCGDAGVSVLSAERGDKPAAFSHLHPLLRPLPHPQADRDQEEADLALR